MHHLFEYEFWPANFNISLRFTPQFDRLLWEKYTIPYPDCYRDCLRRAFAIRRENIESLTIAVTYLQGFHAGKESKNN